MTTTMMMMMITYQCSFVEFPLVGLYRRPVEEIIDDAGVLVLRALHNVILFNLRAKNKLVFLQGNLKKKINR
jgi:hypothetical protein